MADTTNDPVTPGHVAGITIGGLLGLSAGAAIASVAAPVLVPLGVLGAGIVALVPGAAGAIGAWWGHKATV